MVSGFSSAREAITITQVDNGPNAIMRFSNGGVYDLRGFQNLFDDRGGAKAIESQYFPSALPIADPVERNDRLAKVRDLGTQLLAEMCTKGASEWERIRAKRFRIDLLTIEGNVEFHALPWEAINDNDTVNLQLMPIVRRLKEHTAFFDSPSLNSELRVLVITARPWLPNDIPIRAVIQPMLDAGLWHSDRSPRIDVLRGGTWNDLRRRLNRATGQGTDYHIVHFDMHGAVCTRTEALRIAQSIHGGEPVNPAATREEEGTEAFLFFEQEPLRTSDVTRMRAEPKSGAEVAQLLSQHDVQIAVLVTCESASSLALSHDANLAYHLVDQGVPAALGMRHKITAEGAKIFAGELYQNLAVSTHKDPLTHAVTAAREAMRIASETKKVRLNEASLPAIFIGQTPQINVAPPSGQLEERFLKAHREVWRRQKVMQEAEHGIIGRTMDHWIIRSLLFHETDESRSRRNDSQAETRVVSVTGLRGIGKSTLVNDLARHWDQVNHVDYLVRVDCTEIWDTLREIERLLPDVERSHRVDAAIADEFCRSMDRGGLEDRRPSHAARLQWFSRRAQGTARTLRSRSQRATDEMAEKKSRDLSRKLGSFHSRLSAPAETLFVLDKADVLLENPRLAEGVERALTSIASTRNWAVLCSRSEPEWLGDYLAGRSEPFKVLGLDAPSAQELAKRAASRGNVPKDLIPVIVSRAGGHPALIMELSRQWNQQTSSDFQDDFFSGTGNLISQDFAHAMGWSDIPCSDKQLLAPLAAFEDSFLVFEKCALERYLVAANGFACSAAEHVQELLVDLGNAGMLSTLTCFVEGELRELWQVHPALPYLIRQGLSERVRQAAEFRSLAATHLEHCEAILWTGREVDALFQRVEVASGQ